MSEKPNLTTESGAYVNGEHCKPFDVSGATGHYTQVPREVDDFKQAGDLVARRADAFAGAGR